MELELLERENTPENVIQHCIAVCRKAMKIAANFDDADKDLIRKGALLKKIRSYGRGYINYCVL